MNIRKVEFVVCVLLLFLVNCAYGQTLFTHKRAEQTSTQTVGTHFTNISKTLDNCVLISGYSQFENNFFIDSCVDQLGIKETSSIGYVHDVNFTYKNSGWMILSHMLVRLENKRIVDEDLKGIENKEFDKVFFVNSQKGWVIGSNGSIISTEDGGNTWTKQMVDSNFDLEQIVFSNPEKGWIIGSSYKDGRKKDSIFLKTTDGGKEWAKIPQFRGEEVEKVIFFDSQTGWAINQNGEIYKTNDGDFWTKILTKDSKFVDINFINEFSGWGITDKKLLKTTDGGLTWKSVYKLPSVFPYDFSKVIFVDKFNGWLWAENKILQTKDGGKSWKSLNVENRLSKNFIK